MSLEYGFRNKGPPKKLKNLNWIMDSYQHIPINFNAMEKQLNSDHPERHYFKLYELTRFKPNKWVEEKPPAKPVKKQQIKKAFDLGLKLQLKKYSSTHEYKEELQKRRERLKDELMKLSSVNVFEQQLSSRCYSRHEKKILNSVKNNAVKALTSRMGKENKDGKLVTKYTLRKPDSVEKQFYNMFKKPVGLPSPSSNSQHTTLLQLKRGLSR